MAATPQFRQAPTEYNADSENLFRRELENIILVALAIANGVASGESQVVSMTNKRGSYAPPVGVMTYG